MRRVNLAGAEGIGGAWEFAAITRLEESVESDSVVAGSNANRRGA
jgi:hypothetical protein